MRSPSHSNTRIRFRRRQNLQSTPQYIAIPPKTNTGPYYHNHLTSPTTLNPQVSRHISSNPPISHQNEANVVAGLSFSRTESNHSLRAIATPLNKNNINNVATHCVDSCHENNHNNNHNNNNNPNEQNLRTETVANQIPNFPSNTSPYSPTSLSKTTSQYSHYLSLESKPYTPSPNLNMTKHFDNTLLFENLCRKSHTPCHALFELSSIASLLNFISPGSVVIFDIDDTLVKRSSDNCSLLSPNGQILFSNYLQSSICAAMSFKEKQTLLKDLMLSTFSLVEDETAQVVKALQERGCFVFALTARSSVTMELTTKSLQRLGIDFTKSLPPGMPRYAKDEVTGAVVHDGVIYANKFPSKGLIFQRLLARGWISFPVLHKCDDNGCCGCAEQSGKCHNDGKIVSSTNSEYGYHLDGELCPERPVWFIDDSYEMNYSMTEEWKSFAKKQCDFQSFSGQDDGGNGVFGYNVPCPGKYQLISCHYTYMRAQEQNKLIKNEINLDPSESNLFQNNNNNRDDDNDNDNDGNEPIDEKNAQEERLFEKIVSVQISRFLTHGNLVNDSEAINFMNNSPWLNQTSPGSTPIHHGVSKNIQTPRVTAP